ncbi:hypothetical protein PI124_g14142 [Phytophthora idaei]|nr:hypothetical protein PI124_g14142 [Phytophthora idaei]
MIGQVEQRIATATPETVLILLLDPSTKFSVASLIRPSKRAKAKADEEDGADKIADDRTKQTIAEGNKLLVDVHREILCSLNARFSSASQAATAITSPNLDLIPCVDNGEAICGAAIPMTTPGATPFLTLHDQADKASDEKMTKDDLTPLLLVRRGGVVCWRVEALCEHVDILRWFRESGSVLFPSISALASV